MIPCDWRVRTAVTPEELEKALNDLTFNGYELFHLQFVNTGESFNTAHTQTYTGMNTGYYNNPTSVHKFGLWYIVGLKYL